MRVKGVLAWGIALVLWLVPGVASAHEMPVAEAAFAGSAVVGTVRYTVRAGENLEQIAARFGTSVAEIVQANRIKNQNKIYSGIALIIPVSTGVTLASTLATPPIQSAQPAQAPAPTSVRFVASISQQHCWVYRGNQVIANWSCRPGRPGAPTAIGTFKVQTKLDRAYGPPWNVWMPYWLGIYDAGSLENGIHGIPYNASTGSSVPFTVGCIMLDNASAQTLYNIAYVGMPVVIQS